MDDLRSILASREKFYAQADILLDTSGCSVDEAVARLQTLLRVL